jgi:hypothetical protein
VKRIQDYEDTFTELTLLGQKTWNDDEIKKRLFVQNARSIGLVDTVFEGLVSDNSFIQRGFITISLDHIPSDLISSIRKKLQDRFTILPSHPIGLRRTR